MHFAPTHRPFSLLTLSFGLCLAASGCEGASGLDGDGSGSETGEAGSETAAEGPHLIFMLEVDPDAPRLDNLGQPATVPEGNAAQSPEFHAIAAHYLELAPMDWTPLGGGEVIFQTPHTEAGGEMAVDFAQMPVTAPGGEFLRIPLSQVTPGAYPHGRLALSYQEYDLDFRAEFNGQPVDLTGRLGSFVESLTYVESFDLAGTELSYNENKAQGFWAFNLPGWGVEEGQVPAGAITVPNPLDDTSPIPADSCVVTGHFAAPLVITGDEREDVIVTITLSSNQSFEWSDPNGNGVFEPLAGELPVDMGIRGLSLRVE